MLLIVDIDGTIFNNNHRKHLIPVENLENPHSWTEYNSACGPDKPIKHVISCIKQIQERHDECELVFLTSRGVDSYTPTYNQLITQFPSFHGLYMRDMDDSLGHADYKRKRLNVILNDHDTTDGVILWDDNVDVIKMVIDRFPTIDARLVTPEPIKTGFTGMASEMSDIYNLAAINALRTQMHMKPLTSLDPAITPVEDYFTETVAEKVYLHGTGEALKPIGYFTDMTVSGDGVDIKGMMNAPMFKFNGPDDGEYLTDEDFIKLGRPPKPNKYQRTIKPGVLVDVYDVLKAFDVSCPAMAHAVKKCLAAGLRGHKDTITDKKEAIASIQRSIELDK